MSHDEKLPRELVWDGAHVSDLGLTAIADGQEALVESTAVSHVDSCEWCAGRLGQAALLSEAVGQGVAAAVSVVERTASSHVSRPVSWRPLPSGMRPGPKPWRALAAGLAVALLAGLPVLAHLGRLAALVAVFLTRGLPVLAKGGYALASSSSVRSAWPTATLGASALLVVMGLMVAGAGKPRSRSAEGRAS
jgi:hypothetical protein